jgi:hypothetical protein
MTLFNHRKEENLSFVTQRMDLEDIRLKGVCKGQKDMSLIVLSFEGSALNSS